MSLYIRVRGVRGQPAAPFIGSWVERTYFAPRASAGSPVDGTVLAPLASPTVLGSQIRQVPWRLQKTVRTVRAGRLGTLVRAR
jgi:hypothetical protein